MTGSTPAEAGAFGRLIAEVRACTQCAGELPLGPRPVVRGRPSARVLIISQAPGTRVHETGLSFDDRSGDRLRDWLGLDRQSFYDEVRIAIMGMGFCYPGRLDHGGDRPPRPECAPLWHPRLLPHFAAIRLSLLVGSYAIRYYLPQSRGRPISATLLRWREFLPEYFVLPHPSWRTTAWERANPWFAAELLPELRLVVARALGEPAQPASSIRAMSASLNPK
jgi:uracil-DNA glycosylase